MNQESDIRLFLRHSGLLNNPEKRREICREVLTQCDTADEEYAKLIKKILKSITVPGFRP